MSIVAGRRFSSYAVRGSMKSKGGWKRSPAPLALIEAGADVNFRPVPLPHGSWRQPLPLAAGGAMKPRVVAMLIAAGADVTSTGRAARGSLVPAVTATLLTACR